MNRTVILLFIRYKVDYKELDEKELFAPRPIHTPHTSTNNLQHHGVTFASGTGSSSSSGMSPLVAPSPSRHTLPTLIERSRDELESTPSPDAPESESDMQQTSVFASEVPTSQKKLSIQPSFEHTVKSATSVNDSSLLPQPPLKALTLVVPMPRAASNGRIISDLVSAMNINEHDFNEQRARTNSTTSSNDHPINIDGDHDDHEHEYGQHDGRLLPSSKVVTSTSKHSDLGSSVSLAPPTWEPVDTFSFPIAKISIKSYVPDNLTFHSFDDMKHIADGSNSNIFLGKFLGAKVIVKMIKEEVQNNPVALHEFDIEHGMLSRFNHPHIIKLLGAGCMPRRFIVIEFLGGGSLSTLLSQNQEKAGIASRFFKRPTFTYLNLLSRIRDMAHALDYLHVHCEPGATVIHRGE